MVPKNFPTINIRKFSEIDALVYYFQSHPKEYDSVVESWIEDILESSIFTEYYQRRMRRAVDFFIPINNHCYMLGKQPKVRSKIAKLMSLKERLERDLNLIRLKQEQAKYRILRLHQPVASLLVSGLTKEMKAESLPKIHEGEVVFVYAEETTKKSIRGLWANETIYGTYHNALMMGAIKDAEYLPKDCFVGFAKVGQGKANGVYSVKEAFVFEKHVTELTYGIDSAKHSKVIIPKISFENGKLRIPLCTDLWEQMELLEGHFYLYWKSEFGYFFSSKYGLGNEEGLYDII